MDFGVLDNLVCSHSATAASNNGGGSLASETVSKLRLYGSACLNRECADAEHHMPTAKLAKISSCGGEKAKVYLEERNNGRGLTQQMLGFSAYQAAPVAFPYARSSSGYWCASMHGVRGPFTQSQWMELEHQALIYKYMTANVPIPSYLLNPIRQALEHSGFSCFSNLRTNALGWGGFDKSDPDPGRCRRTDGKKWRCSRDVVTGQKYCERHINRGRHRSRKPVEGGATTTNHTPANRGLKDKGTPNMCLKDKQSLDRTELSMGLGVGVGVVASEESQRHKSWGGGPLGEALQTTTSSSVGQCKALNLIPSSTLGVLGGAFAGTG